MTQSAPGDDQAARPSRRRLLHAAVGVSSAVVLAGAAGCVPSDPRVAGTGSPSRPGSSPQSSSAASGRPSKSPAASPTQPTADEALEPERRLGAFAAAILAGPHRAALSRQQRPLLAALVEAHRQHVVALASPEPTTRPVTASPSPGPTGSAPAGFAELSLEQSIARLAQMESDQAAALRRAALQDRGFESLLSGSIGVAATTYASALRSSSATPVRVTAKPHLPMAGVSDVEALQSMVRQLHAIVYGYQLALGHLSAGGTSGQRALSSLKQHRELRDRLITMLVSRSATVPAAAAAYVPSTDPTTSGRSAKLIRQMETALQPFCGLWVASTVKADDRQLALDILQRTTATARRWDAPLTVWPGWRD